MQLLDERVTYTGDFIIEQRLVIKQFADVLNVSQDYLVYQTDFLKAVTLNNKHLAVSAINKVILILKELN